MNTTKQVLYKYKSMIFDEIPVRNYYIERKEVVGNITYISIKKVMPNYVHVCIISILLIFLVIINYLAYKANDTQIRSHTIRVPKEMYYDFETKVIDLDICNDDSNFEVINITLRDSYNKEIVRLSGIEPGDSIGGIPIEYTFSKLPITCTLSYSAKYNNFVFKEIKRDVLVVDKRVVEDSINRDF